MKSNPYQETPVDLIDDPEKPIRDKLEEEKIEELMRSMSTQGLIHPVRLRPKGSRYEVITGHRRTEAARRLHWAAISSLISTPTEDEMLELRFHENEHHLGLKPSEDAKLIRAVFDKRGWTPARIASMTGKSIPWVEERIEMADWPQGLLEHVDAKQISLTVARILMRIPDDTAFRYLVQQAVETGASARQALAWFHSWQQKPWQLPTSEEIEAAREQYKPPPVPLAPCAVCARLLPIHELVNALICSTDLKILERERSKGQWHTKQDNDPGSSKEEPH